MRAAAAAAAVAAAADAARPRQLSKSSMKTTTWMAAAIAGATIALTTTATDVAAATGSAAAAGKAATQKTFATPQEGVKALVDAVRADSANDVLALVGQGSKSWLFSGDRVADRAEWTRFLAAYDRKNSLRMEGDSRAILEAGDSDWSFPAPLVKRGDRWAFDTEAGREEVLNRRVGRNELDTVQTLLAIVDAQREYAASDPDHKGMNVYATKFRSSPGKKDGLYWPTKAGEAPSPLGPLVAQAVREGYGNAAKASGPVAYHGYYYRILTSQGKDAPGGAFNYVVNGKLFGGFAVVAWPASYGNSGVMSFLVNHEGVVYQKDLGPNSAAVATKMKAFDPSDWKKVP
jgi:hypothetical protein